MPLVASLQERSHVTLHFPNDEKREGTIEALPPQLTSEDNRAGGQATYSMIIRPTGKPWPTLPIGSSLNVSIRE